VRKDLSHLSPISSYLVVIVFNLQSKKMSKMLASTLVLRDPLIEHFKAPLFRPSVNFQRLSGLSFVAKDNLAIEGTVAGAGNPEFKRTSSVAAKTAWVVGRCLEAGGACVGKAQMDELAFSVSGENAHYGALDNPAAPGRIVGGSSSGSACAVAMEACDFALGTDTGGSVRVPASYTGVFGFRPSFGAIPVGFEEGAESGGGSKDGQAGVADGDLSGEVGAALVPLAPSFDTIGWFAKDWEVFQRVGDVLLPPTTTTTTTDSDADGDAAGDPTPAPRPPPQKPPSPVTRLIIATDYMERHDQGQAVQDLFRAGVLAAVGEGSHRFVVESMEVGPYLLAEAPALERWTKVSPPPPPSPSPSSPSLPSTPPTSPAAADVDGVAAAQAAMRALQGFEIWETLAPWVTRHGDASLGADVRARFEWARSCHGAPPPSSLPPSLPSSPAPQVVVGCGGAPAYEAACAARVAMDQVEAALDKLLNRGQGQGQEVDARGGGSVRGKEGMDKAVLVLPASASAPPLHGATTTDADFRRRTFDLTSLAGMGRGPQCVIPLVAAAAAAADAAAADAERQHEAEAVGPTKNARTGLYVAATALPPLPLAVSLLGARGMDRTVLATTALLVNP